MEDSKVSSSVKSDDSNVILNRSHETIKTSQILNGNQTSSNNRQFSSGKVMHIMTPGPKKYQNIKKSPDKEPKFIPYEPYKAAVRSIVPELSNPSVAVFKRRLSITPNCSKASSVDEDKEDVITILAQEKQVIKIIYIQSIKIFNY